MTPDTAPSPPITMCRICGHSDRMHRKLDGCMAVVDDSLPQPRRYCSCSAKPDQVRAALEKPR